ncbi:ead/Ea22-like family protein [uncultured Pseudomonas sp.]|uniref:ead/Ea22-like family protein n=1 Tax=uncultured Pseudomonas sp. TaxID=114707 RepID=UPI0025D70BBA|nr:ead/Ea22-like family protein [uncultured Pseudomonas sp.]
MNDRKQLRELCDKATPGPWQHERLGIIQGGPMQTYVNGAAMPQLFTSHGADFMEPGDYLANADFVAAANPAAVLALLDEIERLNALVIERETVRIGQSLQRHDDQEQMDELVALGIQQDKDEIARLKAENERWRQNYEHLIVQHMPRTGDGCQEGWSRVIEARELQAKVDQLKAENAELRRIVSECATACGAGVSPECSLAFMAGLPREIELAMTKEQP